MLLAINIGNTCTTACLFQGNKIKFRSTTASIKEFEVLTLKEILNSTLGNVHIDDCIISSVVNELTEKMNEAVRTTFKVTPLILNSDLELGLKLKVKNPETIGSDRLANIVGASYLYKKKPLIIVDCGTATTFDTLDKNGDFIGGVIMPGFEMQLKALHENTSKLPVIELGKADKAQRIICGNTKSQILAGVIRGHICAIEGLLDLSQKELKEKPFVVLTGGGADIIKEYLPKDKFDTVNPTLTLEGIRLIYERNMD